MALTKVSSGTVKERGLLVAEEVNQNGFYLFTKRLMDIFGSVMGLVFLSPVFLIVALLIKLEDPKGPVFFKQVRIGKDEKEFGMYKFRSMIVDAEERLNDLLKHNEVSGAMFKMKDDPRVTRIGKFIRKTSIDELPQLFNVLKGDMSLVGPRPPLLREVKEYTSYDKQRLLVTPGCTGLWQVTERNNVGFKEMVELDLKYIKRRKLTLDLKIIFKTIVVIFKSNGAS
ncbi:sugar transferase [Bacillus cereus group sp. MYBK245-2]|uniref:UDP-N-acetylgalactosamine-undecaprenyl-phosphate N-acetylgalactosaminephosphotransferase n=1 Tax=Bacillus pacificus TaxID=2026187 RepID=A0A1Y5YZ79_9BACI|nr:MULTISPECIES: sugar transferase [Bacillus cereus group]PEB03853.1 sugar transferase [Bacillus cereus]MCZ7522063.1 sugar transferase [Bacillus pacificus]MDA1573914.1 sugar transferase [Bacillus cereus group sp. TH242-3LC]MED1586506.1 sugar transferase [Bacillus pacificus]UTG89237.1 sugar transferase [Bacillus pacificus]